MLDVFLSMLIHLIARLHEAGCVAFLQDFRPQVPEGTGSETCLPSLQAKEKTDKTDSQSNDLK